MTRSTRVASLLLIGTVLALMGFDGRGARADDDPPNKPPAPAKPQEPAPPVAPPGPDSPPAPESEGPPARDPFQPTDRFQPPTASRARDAFVPTEQPEAMPQLTLRGFIQDHEGQAIALLEVENQPVYLVRKGDTVSLPRRGRNMVIRIVNVGNLSLRVQVGELRREVIVR